MKLKDIVHRESKKPSSINLPISPEPTPEPKSTSRIIKDTEEQSVKEHIQNEQKLNSLVQKSQRVILTVKTVFPWDIFPRTVVIEEHKVDVITPVLFSSRQIESVLIDFMTSVRANTSFFFASLEFEVWGMSINPPIVANLWKKDALKARRIIQGLIACRKEGISIDKFDLPTLRLKLEEIGMARE